jgi:Tfp pilus assembly protein PilF
VDRGSGAVTRQGGLYVRNLSRYVRGRRRQAALLINGAPLPPQSEAARLGPGDVLVLGETGVTVEVAEAAAPPPGPVEAAIARYLRPALAAGPGTAAAAAAGPGPGSAFGGASSSSSSSSSSSNGGGGFAGAGSSRPGSRADASGGWDESDDDEEGGGGTDDDAGSGPSPADARAAAAYKLARGGNPAAAERAVAVLLAESPDASAGWFVWAQLAAGSRRAALARDLFRAAAASAKAALTAAEAGGGPMSAPPAAQPLSARLAKVLRVWARLEWDAGLHGAARRLWRAAANEAFRYPRRLAADVGGVVLHSWALAELERDNVRNARTVIGEALRKCSDDVAVNVLAGSIVWRAGDAEGARALFLRAYQLDRRSRREKQLFIVWPALEAAEGHPERARALYQRGLAAHPNSSKLLNVYACFEARSGNAALARQLHGHALGLDPRSATTMHNRVSWATLELDAGDREAARKLLREGLDHHPNFVGALVLMARLEREAGNLDLAEAYVRRAFKVRRGRARGGCLGPGAGTRIIVWACGARCEPLPWLRLRRSQRLPSPTLPFPNPLPNTPHQASNAFNVAASGELRSIYKARGETALAANVGRHMANMAALKDAKRSGSAWASEAWGAYAEGVRSPEQREVAAAARARKRELGLIRPPPAAGAHPAGGGGWGRADGGWGGGWGGGGWEASSGGGWGGAGGEEAWQPPALEGGAAGAPANGISGANGSANGAGGAAAEAAVAAPAPP